MTEILMIKLTYRMVRCKNLVLLKARYKIQCYFCSLDHSGLDIVLNFGQFYYIRRYSNFKGAQFMNHVPRQK